MNIRKSKALVGHRVQCDFKSGVYVLVNSAPQKCGAMQTTWCLYSWYINGVNKKAYTKDNNKDNNSNNKIIIYKIIIKYVK